MLSGSSTEALCILFMDDETHVLRLCRIMLRSLGYESICVESGAAAEKAVEESLTSNPVAVAVLDINIPDGQGAAKVSPRLRAIHPELRVVVSSGDRFDPAMTDPAAAGFHAALCKPYTREELGERIRAVLAM